MGVVELIVGLTIGFLIGLWQQHKFKKQLRKVVNLYSPRSELEVSLPILSLVRREFNYLQQERKELYNLQDEWQQLIEKAPIGYLLVDENNQLLSCNHQARILLKIDRWQPQQIRLLLELVRSYELDRSIEKTRQSQQVQEEEWIFYFTRYDRYNFKEQYNNKLNSNFETVNAISLKSYSFPLSHKRVGVFLENRQPLVELGRSRDRALDDLAHELKTPLTAILLVSENLVERLQNPERRWVERMLKDVRRLISLVKEWLELTELETDPLSNLKYEKIKLTELINSVWQTISPIADRKKVTLNLSCLDSISLSADKSRLIQVLINLLDNGIKHSPNNSQIIVNVTKKDLPQQKIIIDVIDSGTGFTTKNLPYVFDRLFRGEESRNRNELNSSNNSGGSGLGLSIVRQIILAHGGSIEANNHPELGGAWLQIILPSNKKENKQKVS